MKKHFSSRNIFFLVCLLFLLNRFWPAWGPGFDNGNMIKWDSYGYYLYLPSIFIYDDPGLKKQEWIDTLHNRYYPSTTFYQVRDGHEGMRSVKYPSGSAILWSPFFFTAHLLAEPLGYPADGLSPPYSWAIVIGGCIYAFIGLWFLRKVLLRFFDDPVAAMLMVLITMGTNYWQMAASETVMPHGNSFALNCVLLWLIIRWHDEPTYLRSLAMGLLFGVGVLVRPTEIFWIFVPLLWNVTSWQTFREKMVFFRKHIFKLLVFAVAFTAVIFIQLSYWKYTLDTWVAYGYEESFAITSPFLLKCMLSFKKGWLLYTPLMLVCFAGFYFLWKRKREVFWPLVVFVFVHTWVIFSWECWWYASSFSQRGAIDMYPAMTIPLGFLLAATMNAAKITRVVVGSLIGFCLLLNLFQTWQFNHGIIHGERMSSAYYWRVFGKTSVHVRDLLLLEPDHWPVPEISANDSNLVVVDTYYLTFEEDSLHVTEAVAYGGERSFVVAPPSEFGPEYKRNFHGESYEYEWVRTSVWMRMDTALKAGQQPPLLCCGFYTHERALKWRATPLDTNGYIPGEWRLVQVEFKTPISLYKNDVIRCGVWHPGKTTIYLDNFHVEVLAPKGQRAGLGKRIMGN